MGVDLVRAVRLGRSWSASVLAAVVLAWAGTCRATSGGPLTVEVLGWDAATERVYARQIGHDESGGERDCVFYFDLRATDPTRAHVVERSRQRWSADPGTMDRFERERAALEEFLSHLRPLERDDEGSESLLRGATIVSEGMARYSSAWEPEHRFIVDVGDSILVTAWRDPCVRIVRRYLIPGYAVGLRVLSFVGDPWEGGYEVQRCALTGFAGARSQHLDSDYGVLQPPSPR
jgi:hypothetical protein